MIIAHSGNMDGFLSGSSSAYQAGVFVFGLSGIDRSDFDPYKPDLNRGTVLFDPDFDIYTAANQRALVSFCELLETKVCHLDDDPARGYVPACTSIDHKLVRASGTL